jgi:hypothetical protein
MMEIKNRSSKGSSSKVPASSAVNPDAMVPTGDGAVRASLVISVGTCVMVIKVPLHANTLPDADKA